MGNAILVDIRHIIISVQGYIFSRLLSSKSAYYFVSSYYYMFLYLYKYLRFREKPATVNPSRKEFVSYLCYVKTKSSISIVSHVTNIIYEVLNTKITIFTHTEQTSDSALS